MFTPSETETPLGSSQNLSVSVIVPCYNAEDTLSLLLESLAFQTIKPLEVILVDNDTESGKLAAEFTHEALNIIYIWFKFPEHKFRKGLQINLGLEAASGDVIQVTNCDNVFPKNFLEATLSLHAKYLNLIVTAKYWRTAPDRVSGPELIKLLRQGIKPQPDLFIWKSAENAHLFNSTLDSIRKAPYDVGAYANGNFSFRACHNLRFPSPLYWGRDDAKLIEWAVWHYLFPVTCMELDVYHCFHRPRAHEETPPPQDWEQQVFWRYHEMYQRVQPMPVLTQEPEI